MTKYKLVPHDKYPNIYEYETKKGKKYAVRIGYSANGKTQEFQKMSLKTLSAARSLLREVEENIEKNELGFIKNKKITVQEYYSIFRKDKIDSDYWSATSITDYDSLYTNHILPYFGTTALIKLDRVSYQSFVNEKLKKYSVSSVRAMNNAFMALVNHAVDVGTLERNRLKKIKISKADYKPKKKNLTLEEYETYMEAAEKLLTDKVSFCMVYLSTFGMRRGEIMGLTSRNITFRKKDGLALINILVTRTQANPNGQGTKNESSERMIPLDSRCTELLRFAMQEAAEIKKDYGEILHQDDFIFLNPATNAPFSVSHLNRIMNKVTDVCGIKCHPHMMRHTFATESRLAGADVRSVADFLGHKDSKMTEHYTHVTEESLDNVVNLANSRLH